MRCKAATKQTSAFQKIGLFSVSEAAKVYRICSKAQSSEGMLLKGMAQYTLKTQDREAEADTALDLQEKKVH